MSGLGVLLAIFLFLLFMIFLDAFPGIVSRSARETGKHFWAFLLVALGAVLLIATLGFADWPIWQWFEFYALRPFFTLPVWENIFPLIAQSIAFVLEVFWPAILIALGIWFAYFRKTPGKKPASKSASA